MPTPVLVFGSPGSRLRTHTSCQVLDEAWAAELPEIKRQGPQRPECTCSRRRYRMSFLSWVGLGSRLDVLLADNGAAHHLAKWPYRLLCLADSGYPISVPRWVL
mgnify:CR=1 FL=1